MRAQSLLKVGVLAVVMAVVAVGCNKRPDDAALLSSIQSQMSSDDQLKNTGVRVEARSGNITLTGTVPNDSAHLEAYKIATQTPGVVKVDDQLTVEAPPPPAPVAVAVQPAPALTARERRKQEREAREQARKAEAAAAREKRKQRALIASNAASNSAAVSDVPRQSAAGQSSAGASTPSAAPPPEETPTPPPPPPPDNGAQTSAQASATMSPAPAGPTSPEPAAPAPPPPPAAKQVELAAGTTVTIRMIESVDSEVNHSGQTFHASLEAPLVVGNDVVVRKGADVWVRLTSADSAGKFSGKSALHLELVRMEYGGRSYPLVSSTYSVEGSSQGKSTAEKVGGGAVLGAIIGAIAGGGKGAAIGAGVGGASGGVYQGVSKGKQVRIPAETKLDFQLDQAATVPMQAPASGGS